MAFRNYILVGRVEYVQFQEGETILKQGLKDMVPENNYLKFLVVLFDNSAIRLKVIHLTCIFSHLIISVY
jgi:hypothetical protein